MAYKEIVTKAIIGKGKKKYKNSYQVEALQEPSTILGCWIINHNFSGRKDGNRVIINGSFDANIWYSYDNDTKTDVIRETNHYKEIVHMRDRDDDNEEIIVRSLKQPNCIKVDIDNNKINYVIEKELGIELVSDVKVKIDVSDDEDPWDDIVDENNSNDIDNVNEEFLNEV